MYFKLDKSRPFSHYLRNFDFENYNGDYPITDREAAINGHVRLALYIAGRYKGDTEELASIAIEAVVDAVDIIIEKGLGPPHNVTGYIVSKIHSYLANMKNNLVMEYKDQPVASQDELEVKEFIDNLLEREKLILDLRLKGYNDYEIANMTNYSRPSVTRIRNNIGKKYA